jgi:hypothetical protein
MIHHNSPVGGIRSSVVCFFYRLQLNEPPTAETVSKLRIWIRLESALVRPFGKYTLARNFFPARGAQVHSLNGSRTSFDTVSAVGGIGLLRERSPDVCKALARQLTHEHFQLQARCCLRSLNGEVGVGD